MSTIEDRGADFSVVIPAHNEQAVLGRCLAFVAGLRADEAEVVVVANGCTDDTVAAARAVSGVRVLDLPRAGKAAALNAGDGAVAGFPRIYLDADISISTKALRSLVEVLACTEGRVAAPRPVFVLDGRPLLVRLFYACSTRLPYMTEGMVGTGVYALNAAGRARFEAFPALTADDLFVQRLFQPHEIVVVPDQTFEVQTPLTMAALLAVRTRVAFGNREHAVARGASGARTTGSTARALARLVRNEPMSLPACLVYLTVTVLTRVRARRRGAGRWQRDTSTRSPQPAAVTGTDSASRTASP